MCQLVRVLSIVAVIGAQSPVKEDESQGGFADLLPMLDRMYGDLLCCDPPYLEVCSSNIITKRYGYNNHWSRCDAWVRCVPGARGTFRNITNNCPCGFFWDQTLLICLPAHRVTCTHDPCRSNQYLKRYSYHMNTNAYWVCESRRTVSAGCCPAGIWFNPMTQQCDNNRSGSDVCPCDVSTTTIAVCRLEPNPKDRFSYLEHVFAGWPPMVRKCPGGTFYTAETCGCHGFTNFQTVCEVDFDKSCNTYPLRDVANEVYIENIGVVVDTNANECIYVGNGYLVIPRFENFDWQDKFAIEILFNVYDNLNNDAPLVLNTGGGEASTISIKLGVDRGNLVVRGSITTTVGAFNTSLPYNRNQWNNVYLAYNGQNLQLCIKYDGTRTSSTVAANGMIGRNSWPLVIGKSEETQDTHLFYHGVTRRTRVWTDCLPQDGCPQ